MERQVRVPLRTGLIGPRNPRLRKVGEQDAGPSLYSLDEHGLDRSDVY
jgi:hypothetical protein